MNNVKLSRATENSINMYIIISIEIIIPCYIFVETDVVLLVVKGESELIS